MEERIKLFISAMLLLTSILAYSPPSFASDLMIASFENGQLSDIGTDIGTWTSNSLDTSQGCTMEIIPIYGVMGRADVETNILKITYDVATTGPAFNGIYIKLNGMDLSAYDEISMLIKGDAEKGFTTKFKVELKNEKGERKTYLLKGITSDWQKITIPLDRLKGPVSIIDWSRMSKMSITFDDMTVDSKEGVLYIDEIKLSTGKQAK